MGQPPGVLHQIKPKEPLAKPRQLARSSLTAPWYSSISRSVKYGICLKGLTEMSTGPM